MWEMPTQPDSTPPEEHDHEEHPPSCHRHRRRRRPDDSRSWRCVRDLHSGDEGSIDQPADGEMAITVMPLAAPEADGDLVAVPADLEAVPAVTSFDDQVRQTLQSFPWLSN